MKPKQKAVAVGIVLVAALAYALPVTRDEVAWYVAQSEDQASSYMVYMTDWPKGLHFIDAKAEYDKRTWVDTKRAMIAEAIKKKNSETPDPEARQKRKEKLERFFWQEVTNENTALSYHDYLTRYPNGLFASEAQRQMADLSRQSGGNDATNSTPQ